MVPFLWYHKCMISHFYCIASVRNGFFKRVMKCDYRSNSKCDFMLGDSPTKRTKMI